MSGLLAEALMILFLSLVPIALILWHKRSGRKSENAAARKPGDEMKAG